MKFAKTIFGAFIASVGIGIGYIDYFIISMFYIASLWLSNYVGAPDALAIIMTFIFILMFIVLFVGIAIIALIVFFAGILFILE